MGAVIGCLKRHKDELRYTAKLSLFRNGCGKVYVNRLLDLVLDYYGRNYIVQISTTRSSLSDWCGYPAFASPKQVDRCTPW